MTGRCPRLLLSLGDERRRGRSAIRAGNAQALAKGDVKAGGGGGRSR